MKTSNISQIGLKKIQRGFPLFQMTLRSFYYDLKFRALWFTALLPVIAALLIRLTQEPRAKSVLLNLFDDISVLVFLSLMVVWFSLVLGSSLIADEKESQTLSFLLMRSISREEVIFHKFLAYIAAMAAFYIVPVFGSYLILFSYQFSWIVSYIDLAIGLWIITWLGSIGFGAVYLLTGVVFKRPLIFGLFIALFWNYLPYLLGANAEKYTLSYHLGVLYTHLADRFPIGDIATAFAFIGGLTILSIIISMFSFKQQEIL